MTKGVYIFLLGLDFEVRLVWSLLDSRTPPPPILGGGGDDAIIIVIVVLGVWIRLGSVWFGFGWFWIEPSEFKARFGFGVDSGLVLELL